MPNPTPPQPGADRNLLFGILALQMEFVSRDALIAGMQTWVFHKDKSLGQILVEQGALTGERHALLEALVQEHLKQHGDDVGQSLAAVRPPGVLRDALESLADPDVQASLVHVPATPAADDGSPATGAYQSVGTPTSSGQRFTLVRPHARGGLGEVFVAVDEELHREVALKQIQEQRDHPESRARFVREAEITGGLEHPGIVPVYGLGQYADGRPFYAMRFVRGQSLHEAIGRFHRADVSGRDPGQRSLELRKLLDRFLMVCNAMAYAHSRGVLHRDLKPGNIMLGPYGETLVVDWGLAKLIDRPEGAGAAGEPTLHVASAGDSDATQEGRALGTPAYMSPEQAAGRLDQLGPASDVYSLGATLYCLLTGRAPFTEREPGLLLCQVQQGEFPPPRQVKGAVPAALEAICLKAMALRPGDRYPSAKALADEVEHWLADERVTAYAEAWRGRLLRWTRRHKPLVASAAGMAAVALTATIAAMLLTASAARERQEQALRGLAEERQAEADQQRARAERQEALVRRYLYFSRINMADRAWQENRLDQMEALLDGERPEHTGGKDLRGFEWHYLWRLRHSSLLTIQQDGTGMSCLAFSPDGRRLATASLSEVHVRDASTGRITLTLPGPPNSVNSLTFSPDGRCLATASGDNRAGEVKVWDLATGRVSLSFKGHAQEVNSVAFSPDGKRLASASGDRTVKVWDLATAQETLTFKGHSLGVQSVAFSPDGRRLASASKFSSALVGDGEVKVWDAQTGREELSLQGDSSVAFSPDGRRLASASLDGVKVWDMTTGKETFTLKGHAGGVDSVAFSPDGRRLASASWDLFGMSTGEVKVWDVATGEETLTLKGHTSGPESVTFSPEARRLASASLHGTVIVWDVAASQESLTLYGHTSAVRSVAFCPDGRRVASASEDRTVKVWDLATG
jgi:WD40 repeat protein